MAALKWLGAILESTLTIPYQLADRFCAYMVGSPFGRKAEGSVSSFTIKQLELSNCEGGEENMMVLALASLALSFGGWDEPGSGCKINIPPLRLQELADSAHGA